MKKLTEFSVNYPVTVLMVVLATLLLGYISFRKLAVDLFPELSNPRIYVELKAGERPPEEIEKQFVDGIEALAIRQRHVVEVSSVCKVGSAQVTVEYAWGTDMDEAFLDLQKTLTSFSQNAAIDQLTITQHDPNAAPIMLIALSHPQVSDMDELRKVAENYIRNELIRLEGVAEVEISGQEEKEVVLETDPYLLEAYGLTPDAVASRLNLYNRNVSGGSIVEMGRQYVIKGIGAFQSIEDIANTVLTYRQPDMAGTAEAGSPTRVPVTVKDVAKIELRNKEPQNIVRLNQKRCLGLEVYKETKYNTVRAANELLRALATIRQALPGYELVVVQNQASFVTTAVREVEQSALVGVVLAVIVLYVFLRRIGATAIISVAIPVSVVATFNMMYFNGLTLNIMTLGGLALGAGMLVDNAIVVMENIFRNIEAGLSLREAAIIGAAEVGGAITASTLTTIVVFLPIVYLHGVAGELFKDQAWTVAFALLSSLGVAILVVPMLAARFLKAVPRQSAPRSITFPWYPPLLARILRYKWAVIGSAAGLVALGVLLVPTVGSEFIPKTDLGEFSLELRLPEGTELRRTEQTVEAVENLVRATAGEDLQALYSHIGPSTTTSADEKAVFAAENTATIRIILTPKHRTPAQELIRRVNAQLTEIPDLEAEFLQEQSALQSTLGTEAAPLVVEIKGDDLAVLDSLTQQAKRRLLAVEELFNVRTSFEEGAPEVEVVVDRLLAGVYNISVESISSQLRDQLMGKEAGTWETGGELQDITLHLPKVGVGQLRDLLLTTAGGQQIRLSEVATIRETRAPKEIYRRNQNRIGRVTAHIQKGRPFDHVAKRVEQELTKLDLPPDYKITIAGEEQKRREAFRNLGFALVLSVVLVYMVLAGQFESLLHPFTVMLSVPLAGVGSILAFFIAGKSLNIMAYIGLIMLAGIAVNDSIILVDAINRLKGQGYGLREAIIEAGSQRIRPIIMTSLTTILALLPLTVGFGEGAALRAPMALAVIGGLFTSTLLTLVVIPCIYLVVDEFRARLAGSL
ncbi:MAG: efflux RND transporter permease subunit [candidate division KSB1 bacterium]|nr:efflux RND transporter permease subunit [candidate division KSB1 bacterium]MDZ7391390.1 efflux RND transporter permease subunit [candidate division KSB1 bacterium]